MPQQDRTASVIFGDADIVIREPRQRMRYKEEQAWEIKFKRQVFHRIVQTLNRLGWTCVVPDKDWSGDDPYGHRERMRKMERTRRRIRDYLCNVFSGYTFEEARPGRHSRRPGLKPPTAMEFLDGCYAESWHFKGNWQAYRDAHGSPGLVGCFNSNRKSADGKLLEHGQSVYFFDRKGRAQTGTAYYNINNMWWVVIGKYAVTNEACFELYVDNPGDLRSKRNDKLRRKRLERELNSAMARMDFRRAETLRDLLWPPGEPIFCLWHTEHKAYHRAGFSGYAAEQMEAGKFTRAELKGWENDRNIIVPFGRRP